MFRTVRLNEALVFAAIWALVTAAPLAFAQEPVTCPDEGVSFAAYDVVSVKPVHPDGMIVDTAVYHHPDCIDGASVTVEMLVRSSYLYTFGTGTASFANEDVISGLPDWAKNDHFSLQAKISPEQLAVFAKLDRGQQRACQDNMGRALLAERFKLKIHRQPKQLTTFELVVARGGPKLKESTGPDGKPLTRGSMSMRPSKNDIELIMQVYSMEELAGFLTNANMGVGHRIADKTGLTGRYSFTLTVAPWQVGGRRGGRPMLPHRTRGRRSLQNLRISLD